MNVIIETPKGSSEKYKYDENFRLFRLENTLPAGLVFPFDFGFIHGTKGDDGEPLDVLVISEFKSFASQPSLTPDLCVAVDSASI